MTKRLAIIDGKSVFYRGYYAMPGLSLPDGTPTGGVYGFASLAMEVLKKLQPDYVCVAWDKRGTSIRKRRALYSEYKAGRKRPPQDFFDQIPHLERLLDGFNWPLYELDDYEADDIMGTLAKQAEAKGIETCLITSDLDMLQLISPLTHVYALKKGLSNIEMFSEEHFREKYGIEVDQFIDLKALKGDSSDNIPGVPGVGEKTAIKLLQDYDNLDNIFAHVDEVKGATGAKLAAGKESAYLSKKIAEIWCDAPVNLDLEAVDVRDLDTEKLSDLLNEFAFPSIMRRLPDYMKSNKTSLHKTFVGEDREKAKEIKWPDTPSFNGNESVLIHLEEDMMWLSQDSQFASSRRLADIDKSFWRSLEYVPVVGYDIKALYHAAHKQGVELRFDNVHDLRQGAFLLDPLARDRSIAGLSEGNINDDNPLEVIASLWRVYSEQCKRFDDEPGVARIAHELDFPLTYMLYRMESRGIKLDSKRLGTMSKELEKEYKYIEQKMYSLAGKEFNIGSPAQLSEVLFETLELPTTGVKKGKTGYSTGQKELDKLRGQHPIIELIERSRELAKLKNTYVDTLPTQTDESGRLHTTFSQDVAVTGRLSSSNPNLQNIPIRTELGRKIREAFIPDEGNVLISADYSQFELRLAAVMSGDENMINSFKAGDDIHTKTAAEVYKIPIDDVTKDQRRDAKVINFGVLYGMGPHALAQNTGMSFAEAKKFIDEYFKLRQPIKDYIDTTLEKAKTDGYVETLYGRRRPTPDILSSNFMVREAAKRAAANMPIQGTEADLMKRAMLKVDEKIKGIGEQILQVHDSILIECPRDNADKITQILVEVMESVAPELDIPLNVDVYVGDNWGEL